MKWDVNDLRITWEPKFVRDQKKPLNIKPVTVLATTIKSARNKRVNRVSIVFLDLFLDAEDARAAGLEASNSA